MNTLIQEKENKNKSSLNKINCLIIFFISLDFLVLVTYKTLDIYFLKTLTQSKIIEDSIIVKTHLKSLFL